MRKFLFLVPPVLLLFLLALNLSLVFTGGGRSRRIFFFPMDSGKGMNGEIRNVSLEPGMERQLKVFMDELLLGPVSLEMNPVAPPGVKLKSIIYRDGRAYFDFSSEFMRDGGPLRLDCKKRMELVRKNILFNFPQIRNIVITVDGQLPYSGFFAF